MNLAVFGAGAWGTAIAIHACRLGQTVTLVPRRLEQALELATQRENRQWLPGHPLPPSLQIGWEAAPVLMEADAVLLACPSAGLAALCRQVQEARAGATQLRLALTLCKGLEAETHRTPVAVAEGLLPGLPVGVLTGPSHAEEVASGLPTALVLASPPAAAATAAAVQKALSNHTLRLYTSSDVVGAELGGCLKNVYAVAAGLCDGLGLGDNAKAALLTRALAEMMRLGTALGGRAETFAGLSGFGDLVATCYGQWSRNRTLGQRVAEGADPAALIATGMTAEGYRAAAEFARWCAAAGLAAPILEAVAAVLAGRLEPRAAVAALMRRDLKAEG